MRSSDGSDKNVPVRRRMKNLLLFFPNMIMLCARLMTDPRVPKTEKALLAGAVIYAIIPFDLIPDMIPFVGQIDDVYLISITLLRLMDKTDPAIVREHWNGGGDVVEFIKAAAQIAGKMLPQRLRRILTSRVEVTPIAKVLPKPLLVERPAVQEPRRAGLS
jgi:uncharacterized membrane protein YkvA (DUF1232 family)